jgi:hypothetical protein
MEAVVAKKEPEAGERVLPDHRCCLSNFFIAYKLRLEGFPWLSRGTPTDPMSPY